MPDAATHLADAGPPQADRNASQQPPAGWVAASVAAQVLGLGVRAVQLQCRAGQRTAQLCGHAWYVDPASDPALRIAAGLDRPGPALAGGSLANLTAAQRDRARQRMDVVLAYEASLTECPAPMPHEAWMGRWTAAWNARGAAHLRVAPRTLHRWLAAWQRGGVAALVDRRGGARTAAPFTADARQFILGEMARENAPSLPYIVAVARGLARELDWQIPALRTVQQWLQKRVHPHVLVAGRHPKKYRDRAVSHVSRDWTLVPAGAAWVADHRILDVLVPRGEWSDEKKRVVWSWHRPWLTLWLDCRSWLPVGWCLDFDTPNGDRVMSTFIAGVEEYGAPQDVILDNGKDFRRRDFAGGRSWRKEYEVVGGRLRKIQRTEPLFDAHRVDPLLQSLGVTPHFAEPFNARAKVIERFFRILSNEFDRTWPTYCGRSPAHRPEGLKGLRAADVDHEKLALPALRDALDRWITADYSLRPSPAKAAAGRSPLRAFHELRDAGQEVLKPPEVELSLLLSRSRSACVRANGVWVQPFGRHYWSDDLEDRRGASGNDTGRKVVYRYRADDPAKVFVFDHRTDKFLTVATPYIGEGLHPLAEAGSDDAARLAEALAHQRRQHADMRTHLKALHTGARNVLIEAHARAGHAAGVLDDPKQIVRAHPLPAAVIRPAAGGELSRAAAAGQRLAARHEATRAAADALERLAPTGTDDADDTPTPHPHAADRDRRGRTALDILSGEDEHPDPEHNEHGIDID